MDKKADAIERSATGLAAKEEEIKKRSNEVEKLTEQRVQELERISGLTSEQAKEYLLKTVEDEVKHDTARLYKELESRAKEEAGKKAREYVVNAIQKCAADHVAETTISVVQLPNDEMKGRIIGRQGRNIRRLETMTGVDLIIDDPPSLPITNFKIVSAIRNEIASRLDIDSFQELLSDSIIASDSTRTPCSRRYCPPSWNAFSIMNPMPSSVAPD